MIPISLTSAARRTETKTAIVTIERDTSADKQEIEMSAMVKTVQITDAALGALYIILHPRICAALLTRLDRTRVDHVVVSNLFREQAYL
jgi:hypothetical protein